MYSACRRALYQITDGSSRAVISLMILLALSDTEFMLGVLWGSCSMPCL